MCSFFEMRCSGIQYNILCNLCQVGKPKQVVKKIYTKYRCLSCMDKLSDEKTILRSLGKLKDYYMAVRR